MFSGTGKSIIWEQICIFFKDKLIQSQFPLRKISIGSRLLESFPSFIIYTGHRRTKIVGNTFYLSNIRSHWNRQLVPNVYSQVHPTELKNYFLII
jgi:hypothetical protein